MPCAVRRATASTGPRRAMSICCRWGRSTPRPPAMTKAWWRPAVRFWTRAGISPSVMRCAVWLWSCPAPARWCWTRAAGRATIPAASIRPCSPLGKHRGPQGWISPNFPFRRPPSGIRRWRLPWPPPTACRWRRGARRCCWTYSPPWPWTNSGGYWPLAAYFCTSSQRPGISGSSRRSSMTIPIPTRRRRRPMRASCTTGLYRCPVPSACPAGRKSRPCSR